MVKCAVIIDGETVEKAKKLGVNLSQFCENALKKQ